MPRLREDLPGCEVERHHGLVAPVLGPRPGPGPEPLLAEGIRTDLESRAVAAESRVPPPGQIDLGREALPGDRSGRAVDRDEAEEASRLRALPCRALLCGHG